VKESVFFRGWVTTFFLVSTLSGFLTGSGLSVCLWRPLLGFFVWTFHSSSSKEISSFCIDDGFDWIRNWRNLIGGQMEISDTSVENQVVKKPKREIPILSKNDYNMEIITDKLFKCVISPPKMDGKKLTEGSICLGR
jgi:hypothetical protein